MYHQLISEQRSQIFALLQKKTARKEIADIVGISQSTLSREIKRNSTSSGKYIWPKAHDMAMQHRKNTVTNAKLSDELVWRIKEYITNDQWSPRQISGYLRMNEGIEVSYQSIYNIIHNDTTEKLAEYTRLIQTRVRNSSTPVRRWQSSVIRAMSARLRKTGVRKRLKSILTKEYKRKRFLERGASFFRAFPNARRVKRLLSPHPLCKKTSTLTLPVD